MAISCVSCFFTVVLCSPWFCAAQHELLELQDFLTAVRVATKVAAGSQRAVGDGWEFSKTVPKVAPQWSANITFSGKVAPQFTADVTYSSTLIGMNITDGNGVFVYDRLNQRFRTTTKAKDKLFFPNGTMSMDQLSRNVTGHSSQMTSGEGKDGVCMPMATPYADMFGWLNLAKYGGSKIVRGEPCDLWNFTSNVSMMGKVTGAFFSVCLSSGGVPRDFEQKIMGVGFFGGMQYGFLDVKLGDPGEEAFQPSQACANYPNKPCEDAGTRTLRNVYRVWAPPEPLELRDRNAGDPMGDLSFLCTQAAGKGYRSKLVTLWEVDVSTAYGQYAPCNFDGKHNRCMGESTMLTRAGRRSSQMQGNREAGGQCTENDDIGSQFSFPSQAECKAGERPSATGCGWGSARALRTITVGCLVERGLLEACGAEFGHAPFKRSIDIFTSAFTSNETSKGGCPQVDPYPASLIVV